MGNVVTEKTDVFSFGILLWEIFTQISPYNDLRTVEDVEQAVLGGQRPDENKCPLPMLRPLITKCWENKPRDRPTFKEVLDDINEIRVDQFLTPFCPKAARLWKKYFKDDDEVTLKSLLKVYFGGCTEQEKLRKVIAQLFGKKAVELHTVDTTISIEEFSKLLQWFGSYEGHKGQSLDENILSIASQPWFYGTLSADEASRTLADDGPKYLVRLNTGGSVAIHAAPFIVSTKQKHIRVQKGEDGEYFYEADKQKKMVAGKTLIDVITTTVKSGCPGCLPLGASPFAAIFEDDNSPIRDTNYS